MDLEHIYKDMLEERASRVEYEGTIRGTCEEFCPRFEHIERAIRGDISKFEQNVVFKKFYRSTAGKSKSFPEDVRPINILLKATNYLIDLSYNDFSIEMYKFIENRTRSIRTDINLQELNCCSSIKILEKIARFHIVYNYALFDNREFESHLNLDQLKKIILTLEDMYTINNIYNEEFIAYNLLLSIDSKYPQAEKHLFLRKVQQSYEIRKFYQQGNLFKYFLECRKLDFLSFCVSLSAFDRVRMKGIEVFGKSFVEKIDISLFQKILYCSKMETKSLLDKMNVEVTSDKADFKDSDIYETESCIYKERKEKIGLSSLSVLIYLGDIDYKIHKILLNKFLCSFIELTYHKRWSCRSQEGRQLLMTFLNY
ncbi:80 kDa MCM3-associated protein [Nosema bombycis CQ1]|uniref:80 kDa MCM3-associated protein n=1 Tax=Nosema bombycis (strain CQ1 / CVCC 102059) TaxID=578461 RepID=R0MBK0_NOSB1|nr:80 kDa MCM3-associated protein [Nosema bombycis CQ1]|eukprot:EOB15329.1 80 kDa MCM3-associated protein [Nosema bombycis CQ1]